MNGNGLDHEVNKIKMHLEKNLKFTDVIFYGRAYKNPTKSNNDKLVPEIYTGSKEYKEVLTNDLKNGISFFFDSGKHTSVNAIAMETELTVVFILNLSKLKGDLIRRDSDVQIEVLSELMKLKQFESIELTTGLQALKEFDTSKIKLSDMQPWHIFAIKGNIKYNINNC